MKVYIDIIFLENVIITMLLIYETEQIINIKVGVLQRSLASVFSGVYIVIMLVLKLNFLNMYICKLLIVFVNTYIAFLPKSLKLFIKINIIYFLVATINIGTIELIKNILNLNNNNNNIKILLYFSSFLLGYVSLSNIWKIFKIQAKEDGYLYKAIIKVQNVEEEYKAFLDTGNTVYCYEFDLPVIFATTPKKINIKKLEQDLEIIKTNIEVTTLNNKTIEKGYVLRDIEIIKQKEIKRFDAVVVFKNMQKNILTRHNMLLNFNMNKKEGERI